jgi:hypothetical protein
MSLDIALAQKAGEMSSADVRLVSRESRSRDTDRQTGTLTLFEILIKMADESKVGVLPTFNTLC